MSYQTEIPTIPDVRPDNLVEVLDIVKQIIEVRENRRFQQSELDRFASVRDMTSGTALDGVKSNLRVWQYFNTLFFG